MRTLGPRAWLLLAAPILLAQAGQPPRTAPATTVRSLPIDWSRAQQDRRAELQRGEAPRLERVTAQQLDGAHLPVLLPNTSEMRASGMVFTRPHSYAATLSLPGATIEVFGSSRAAALAPAMEKDLRSRMKLTPAGYLITDSEYGQELSMTRYGAAYSVMITCKNPRTDERCTKPDFLVALADRMAMFGGTPEANP